MEIQYFLPSEIARLVLGYLKEQNCLKTYQSFLKESPHLLEYISLLKGGQEYPTTIAGKNLLNMLQEYAALKLCNESKCTTNPVNALWRQFDSVVEHLKDRQVMSTRLWKGTTQTARTRCQIVDNSLAKAARCKEISSALKGKESNVNMVMDVSSIPTTVDRAEERIHRSSGVTVSRLVPNSVDSNCCRQSIQAVGGTEKNVSAMGNKVASHSVSFRTRSKTGKSMQPSNDCDTSFNTGVSSVLSENAPVGLEKDLSSTVLRDTVSDDKRDSSDKIDVSVCCDDHLEENLSNCDSGKCVDEEIDVEGACDTLDIHDMSSPKKASNIVIRSPLELQVIKNNSIKCSKIFTESVTNPNSLDISQRKSLSETLICRQQQTIDSQLPESDSSLQQTETGPKCFQAMNLLSSQTSTGPIQIPVDNTNMTQSSQTSAIKNTERKEISTTSELVTPTKQHPNRQGSENFISSAKLLQSLTDAFQTGKSPRRKKPPKKRVSTACASDKSATEGATHIDYNSSIAGTSQEIIEKLLNDTTLHEKLAENINKGLNGNKHSGAKSKNPKKKDMNYYTTSSSLDDLFDMQVDKEDDCSPVENRHSSEEIAVKGHCADVESSDLPSFSSSSKDTQPFSPHAMPISPLCREMLAQSPRLASNNSIEAGPETYASTAVSNSDSPVTVKSVVRASNEIVSPHTPAKANFPLNSQNIVQTPVSDLSTVSSTLINIRTSEPVQSTAGMVMTNTPVPSSSYNQHLRNSAATVTPSRTSMIMEPMFSTNGNYNAVHHGHLPYSPSVCEEITLPSTPNGQDYTLHHCSSPVSPHMSQATACLAINSDLTNSVPPVVTEVEVAFSSSVSPRLTSRPKLDLTHATSQMGGNEARTTQQPGTYHSFIKEVVTNGKNSTPVSCINAPVLNSYNVGNLALPISKAYGNGIDPLSETSNLVPSKSYRQVTTATINSHPSLLTTATNVFGSTINLADAASILPESFPMPQTELHISTDNKDTQAQPKKRKGRRIRIENSRKNKETSDFDTKVVPNVAATHQVIMSSGSSNSTQPLSINASDVNIINHKLIILSPGGKSLIQIPIMGYEHNAELETVSGTVANCPDNIQIWSENLETNTQLALISTVASTFTTETTTTCGTTHKHVTYQPGKTALEYNSTSTAASGTCEGLLLPTYVPEMGDDEQISQQETLAFENEEPVPKSCSETAFDILESKTSPSERKSSLDSSDKLIAYPLGLLCSKNKGIHVRALDFGQIKTSCVKVLHAEQEQSKNGNKFENQVTGFAKAVPKSRDSSIERVATDNCENDPEVVEKENKAITTNKCRDLKQIDKETTICKPTGPATIMSKPKLVMNSNLNPGELRMPGFGRGRRNSENEELVGVGKFRKTYRKTIKQEEMEMTTVDEKEFPKMSAKSKPKRVTPKRGATRTAFPKSGGKKEDSSDRAAIKDVPDDNPAEHTRKTALNLSLDPGSLEICIDQTEVKAQNGKEKLNKKSDMNQNAIEKDTKEAKKTHKRDSKGKGEEFADSNSTDSREKKSRKSAQEKCSILSQSNSVGQDSEHSKPCSEKEITGQPLNEPMETGMGEESKKQMSCDAMPSPPKPKSRRRTSKCDSDKDSTLLLQSSTLINSCKNWKVSLKKPSTGRRNKKDGKSKDSKEKRNRKKLDETAKSSSDTSNVQVLDDRLCTRNAKHNTDTVLKSKKASKDKTLHPESLVADFVQLKERENKCKEAAYITSPCPKELRSSLTPVVRIPKVDDKEENKVKRNSFENVKAVNSKDHGEQLKNIDLEQEKVVIKGINLDINQISEEEIENACLSISETPVPNQKDDMLSSHIFHTAQHWSENNESVFETSHCGKGLSTSTPMKQTYESVKTSADSSSDIDETPRKCEVLEKLGLTPKKIESEKTWELYSSHRPNVMNLIITQPSPSTKGSNPSEMKTPAKIKTPRKRVSTPHKVLTSPVTKLKSPLQSTYVSPARNNSTISLGECRTKENQEEPQNSQQRGQKRSFGEVLKQCDLQPTKKVKQPQKREKKPDVMSKLQSLDIDALLSRVHNQGQSNGSSSPFSS
ncbi:hypothetical protein ACJMK2_029098 [Sinanodonta woodiana]|uniref:LisH domain-containing protein n=1 Tax=Sinanodonta woodiana TaxID=1069815 RepID=A0ABD3XB38_SINWO